jgi:hypothetical protein
MVSVRRRDDTILHPNAISPNNTSLSIDDDDDDMSIRL